MRRLREISGLAHTPSAARAPRARSIALAGALCHCDATTEPVQPGRTDLGTSPPAPAEHPRHAGVREGRGESPPAGPSIRAPATGPRPPREPTAPSDANLLSNQ